MVQLLVSLMGIAKKSSTEKIAPVAQLDRASDFGSEGLGFESLRAHHWICPFTHPLDNLAPHSARDQTVIEGEVKWLRFQLREHAELSLVRAHLVDHVVMDLYRR